MNRDQQKYLEDASKRAVELALEILDKYEREPNETLLTGLIIATAELLARDASSSDHLMTGLEIVQEQLKGFAMDYWKTVRAN